MLGEYTQAGKKLEPIYGIGPVCSGGRIYLRAPAKATYGGYLACGEGELEKDLVVSHHEREPSHHWEIVKEGKEEEEIRSGDEVTNMDQTWH